MPQSSKMRASDGITPTLGTHFPNRQEDNEEEDGGEEDNNKDENNEDKNNGNKGNSDNFPTITKPATAVPAPTPALAPAPTIVTLPVNVPVAAIKKRGDKTPKKSGKKSKRMLLRVGQDIRRSQRKRKPRASQSAILLHRQKHFARSPLKGHPRWYMISLRRQNPPILVREDGGFQRCQLSFHRALQRGTNIPARHPRNKTMSLAPTPQILNCLVPDFFSF